MVFAILIILLGIEIAPFIQHWWQVFQEAYSIKKQECANHAFKCYRTSPEQLIQDKPSYKVKHKLTEGMRQKLTKTA